MSENTNLRKQFSSIGRRDKQWQHIIPEIEKAVEALSRDDNQIFLKDLITEAVKLCNVMFPLMRRNELPSLIDSAKLDVIMTLIEKNYSRIDMVESNARLGERK
jgi:hypothetical protein